MANLSQQKRERMLSFLETLKAQHTNDDSLMALGEIEKELKAKKYGLVWEEHEEAVDVMMQTHIPVFTEDASREIKGNPSTDRFNFLLEGDNLHSLRLLEKTHRGKIDVIYIDPPYNTENKDFVYDDCKIGENDGFRHSKWLSFMESRLKIAKKLLSDSGCIFISIDDNEQAALKMLCDEVFGEKSFVALIPWRKRTAKSDVPFGISQDCESILCYAGLAFKAAVKGKERKYYETPDFPGRPWRIHDLTKQTTAAERPKSYFTIVDPKTGKKYPANPNATWRITVDTFDGYYSEGRIVFPGDYDFLRIKKPVLRYWKEDDMKKAGDDFGLVAASTFLPSDIVGMTQDGTKEITDIFSEKKFNFPKPLSLIKYLIEIATLRKRESIILDFFAGSGTTGQAVMELNQQDGGQRKFILCTNNENGICENVTYQRLKTAITGKRKDGSVYSDGISANLMYFCTDFVDKESEELSEELLKYIREMIQLEYGIKIDDQQYVIIMDDEEMDAFEQNIDKYTHLKAIFINQDVFLSSSQEEMLKNIDTYIIPDYYFDFELREAGEIW